MLFYVLFLQLSNAVFVVLHYFSTPIYINIVRILKHKKRKKNDTVVKIVPKTILEYSVVIILLVADS